jgi:hypothetical protein
MRHARVTAALIPAIAFAASGFAFAATHVDGGLPVYPNAVPRGFTWTTPKIDQALKFGFGIFADSNDSVSTIGDWYGQNLPKSCARTAIATAVRYECSTGVVTVRTQHGKTLLIILPNPKPLR